MVHRNKRLMKSDETQYGRKPSSADLIRMMGGKSRHVLKGPRVVDSIIAVYRDRVTYTFIMDSEVASIHFDRKRGEIFFRGHNLRNMKLSERKREALLAMKSVLAGDEKGKEFLSEYEATLDRLLADK